MTCGWALDDWSQVLKSTCLPANLQAIPSLVDNRWQPRLVSRWEVQVVLHNFGRETGIFDLAAPKLNPTEELRVSFCATTTIDVPNCPIDCAVITLLHENPDFGGTSYVVDTSLWRKISTVTTKEARMTGRLRFWVTELEYGQGSKPSIDMADSGTWKRQIGCMLKYIVIDLRS
jgi:hypothetical protein